jgi:LysM repeat protein
MRRTFCGLIFGLIALSTLAADAPRTAAQAGDPGSLIAEVNGLRAARGLAPYKANNALMAAAQAHSEYQAKAGSATHTGAGGTRPYDRAIGAGYGGGRTVYVSENIAMGTNLTPQQAVFEIWQDAVHLETMISTLYRDIGAGVAVSGDYVYYTIDVGVVAEAASNSDSPPSGPTPNPNVTPEPTAMIIQPVVVATPLSDGSVVHVVDAGQALWNIASAYGIPLPELLALNGLTEDSLIHPGDKLIVQPASITQSPTSAGAPGTNTPESKKKTKTVTPTSTTTRKSPTASPTASAAAPVALAVTTATARPDSQGIIPQGALVQTKSGPDYLLVIIVVLALTGLLLILVGSVLKRST